MVLRNKERSVSNRKRGLHRCVEIIDFIVMINLYLFGEIILNWEKSTGHREKSIEHAGNSTHGKKSQFILRRWEWCYIYLIHF